VMDIPAYSEEPGYRLFGTEDRTLIGNGHKSAPDVRETAEQLSSRVIDNNYIATYFPDVILADAANRTQVKVPASVAAMKALAFSDSVSFPWFAPAGFNRGALDSVTSMDVRLTSGDRDELYDARINPIASFPDGGFVIFGQKTLQMAKSALDRVNVRRMLLEIKRLITRIAQRLLFEPNNEETRARFINLVTPLLATIQAQAGVDSFRVVMDDTNNTEEDVENNRLNGRIVVVPTRAIEFIAIDFIITNSGVSFE
jgi:phage tail sheath protein FI